MYSLHNTHGYFTVYFLKEPIQACSSSRKDGIQTRRVGRKAERNAEKCGNKKGYRKGSSERIIRNGVYF